MAKSLQILLQRLGYELRKVDNFHLKPNREVQIQLGRYALAINTRNPISIHYTKYPDYGSELGRLAKAVGQKYPGFSVIDIGANIGDTAAIVKNAVETPIVCIEGDAYCYGFLSRNVQQFKDVQAFQQFLGENDEQIPARLEKSSWNTTIIPGSGDLTIELLRLDTFMSRNGIAGNFKLIKVDTEGFDVKIIRGASGLIERQHPVIYFEYNRHNMDAIGEKGIDTLYWLRDRGYEDVLVYEDSGRFMLSLRLSEPLQVEQMHRWIGGSPGVSYVDLVVFHRDDQDIALQVVGQEAHR
ncbi:MAG TPA: FkbM family methyltransferase [Dinghuibacter sp.]|uniref:FkbM family methyltransferase n=1 Tax=Dinghuibacter sp. TaxID=2024697 RepID=UPI002B8F2D7B|nr:FkbM family methyltransferase [Dinghuibacter sp.]HTJ12604.1 FkbM family methyltransferase [Dinghuibacter sp.]